jgi:hypothetical protein
MALVLTSSFGLETNVLILYSKNYLQQNKRKHHQKKKENQQRHASACGQYGAAHTATTRPDRQA